MIKVQTFLLPAEQDKANEYLATHKPEGQIHFNRDMIVIFHEDGEYLVEYQISDLEELLRGNANARFQQEVGLCVANTQLADLKEERSKLKSSHNKGRVEEIDNLTSQITAAISSAHQSIAMQDIKAQFVKDRIALLKRSKGNDAA